MINNENNSNINRINQCENDNTKLFNEIASKNNIIEENLNNISVMNNDLNEMKNKNELLINELQNINEISSNNLIKYEKEILDINKFFNDTIKKHNNSI